MFNIYLQENNAKLKQAELLRKAEQARFANRFEAAKYSHIATRFANKTFPPFLMSAIHALQQKS